MSHWNKYEPLAFLVIGPGITPLECAWTTRSLLRRTDGRLLPICHLLHSRRLSLSFTSHSYGAADSFSSLESLPSLTIQDVPQFMGRPHRLHLDREGLDRLRDGRQHAGAAARRLRWWCRWSRRQAGVHREGRWETDGGVRVRGKRLRADQHRATLVPRLLFTLQRKPFETSKHRRPGGRR